MSAFQILKFASEQALDTAANVLAGATLSFSLTGTSTATNAYADKNLTIPLANPLSADAAGNFVSIFLDPTITYRVVLKSSAGVTLKTWDPANEQLLTQALIGFYLYPRTSAEISAGVTPVNHAYVPGDVRRYGAMGDGTTDDTTAIQNAITVASVTVATFGIGGYVYLPKGTYRITSTLTFSTGLNIYGDGYLATTIRATTAIVMIDYTPVAYTEAGISFEHLSIIGDATVTDDLVQLGNGTFAQFYGVRLRNTLGSCIRIMSEFLNVELDYCIMESFAQYGIEITGLASLLGLNHIQVNANDVNGVAVIGVISSGAGQVTLSRVNVNGNSLLDNVLKLTAGSLSQVGMRECYAEAMVGPIVGAASTGTLVDFLCENGNFATSDSVDFDLSGSAVHQHIILRNTSSNRSTGTFFVPGATTDYEVSGITVNGGTVVFGFGSATNVSKALNGSGHINATNTYTATETGCTTSPTGTVRYVSNRGQVTLYLPAVTGTSNANTCTFTGMPDEIKPTRVQVIPCRYTDNGVDALGLASIGTNGTITLTNQAGSTTFFTSSGTKGSGATTLHFSME